MGHIRPLRLLVYVGEIFTLARGTRQYFMNWHNCLLPLLLVALQLSGQRSRYRFPTVNGENLCYEVPVVLRSLISSVSISVLRMLSCRQGRLPRCFVLVSYRPFLLSLSLRAKAQTTGRCLGPLSTEGISPRHDVLFS